MRHARIKPDHCSTWHHCYNRIAGTPQDLPFGEVEKEQFVRILNRVCRLFTVKVVAYEVMSNHFHLLINTPAELPSEEEICERYAQFHNGKRNIKPGTKKCTKWQARSRDVSWFMRYVQQLFTCWYNRSRPVERHGTLWAGRFKNTVLESGEAVWCCWKYIECNALRAGLITHPAEYRFGSYGVWKQSGIHPFQRNVEELLLPVLAERFGFQTMDRVQQAMDAAVAEAVADNASENHFDHSVSDSMCVNRFTLTVRRRVRYWTDGLVIGSEIFVRDIMSRFRNTDYAEQHRVEPVQDPSRNSTDSASVLCAWRRLRV
jgi:REP element-mobilizing transposase RayT